MKQFSVFASFTALFQLHLNGGHSKIMFCCAEVCLQFLSQQLRTGGTGLVALGAKQALGKSLLVALSILD